MAARCRITAREVGGGGLPVSFAPHTPPIGRGRAANPPVAFLSERHLSQRPASRSHVLGLADPVGCALLSGLSLMRLRRRWPSWVCAGVPGTNLHGVLCGTTDLPVWPGLR
jgi:hypothetical protein